MKTMFHRLLLALLPASAFAAEPTVPGVHIVLVVHYTVTTQSDSGLYLR